MLIGCQLRPDPDDGCLSDVGTGIYDVLDRGEQVDEIRVGEEIAFPVSHTVQVIDLECRDQLICDLLQRLHLKRGIHIPGPEGGVRVIEDMICQLKQDPEFLLRHLGEGQASFGKIPCRFGNFGRLVSDSLKF